MEAEDITAAFSEFQVLTCIFSELSDICIPIFPSIPIVIILNKLSQSWERGNASMGYCGTQPCGQTKGPRFFYNEERTPTDILMAGEVSPLYLIGTVAKTFFAFVQIFAFFG